MLNCIDNSGASIVECVANLRMKRHAKIGMNFSSHTYSHIQLRHVAHIFLLGDRIIVVVQKQRNFGEGSGPGGSSASTAAANKVRRGDIRHAIVVRTTKKLQRKDGMVVRFDDNACVLINKAGEPLGTRLTSKSPLNLAMLWGVAVTCICGKLTTLQVLLDPSYEISSGRRFCHWHQCIYRAVCLI